MTIHGYLSNTGFSKRKFMRAGVTYAILHAIRCKQYLKFETRYKCSMRIRKRRIIEQLRTCHHCRNLWVERTCFCFSSSLNSCENKKNGGSWGNTDGHLCSEHIASWKERKIRRKILHFRNLVPSFITEMFHKRRKSKDMQSCIHAPIVMTKISFLYRANWASHVRSLFRYNTILLVSCPALAVNYESPHLSCLHSLVKLCSYFILGTIQIVPVTQNFEEPVWWKLWVFYDIAKLWIIFPSAT